MDILINNMEMPKACYNHKHEFCPLHFFAYEGGHFCTISDCKPLKTKRPKGCPLVEVVPVEQGKVYPVDAKFWVEAST